MGFWQIHPPLHHHHPMGFSGRPMILPCTTSFLSFHGAIMHNTTRLSKPKWQPKELACLHYGLGLLVAGIDLHDGHHALSSALAFWKHLKDIGQQSKVQLQNNNKKASTVSWFDTLYEWQKDFEVANNWRSILLALGPWIRWLHFEEGGQNNQTEKKINMAAFYSKSVPSSGDHISNPRFWTNVLIGLNILMFIAQEASHGRLLLWGAKVNNLIDQGQLWRLITPSLLHANIGHLLINCYSLNSIGPVVESLGPKRFIAVYIGSALAGVTTSYVFSTSPSVGSSGAIFGLAGSLAVFLLRHRNLLKGGQANLLQITRVITANMVLGLISSNIDNWGHLGGLLGGAFFSWLLGPAYSFESPSGGGRKVLIDHPPIALLFRGGRKINP